MTNEFIQAILTALAAGYLVELVRKPDGTIIARTVRRKEIKVKT